MIRPFRSLPRQPALRALRLAVVPCLFLTGCFQPTLATKQLSTELGRSITLYGDAYEADLAAAAELAKATEKLALRLQSQTASLQAGQDRLIAHADTLQLGAMRDRALMAFEAKAIEMVVKFPETFEAQYLKRIQPDLDRLTLDQKRLDERLRNDRENAALYREAALSTMRLLSLQRQISEDNRRFITELIAALEQARASFKVEIDKEIAAAFPGALSAASTQDIVDARTVLTQAEPAAAEPAPLVLSKPFEERRIEVIKAFADLRGAWSHVDHVVQTDNDRESQISAFFEGLTGSVVKIASGKIPELSKKIDAKLVQAAQANPGQKDVLEKLRGMLPKLAESATTLLEKQQKVVSEAMTKQALDRIDDFNKTKPNLSS